MKGTFFVFVLINILRSKGFALNLAADVPKAF